MTKEATHLFEVALDKDELWNLYLDSFPAGTNEIYRERREYDCSCCRQFVKNIGNVVRIKNNVITTIWDFQTFDDKYQPVLAALSSFVKSKTISDVWVSKERRVGVASNYEQTEYGDIKEWDHFFVDLPSKFLVGGSIAEAKGELRDVRNVFKRSLDEITKDSVLTVLELIAQGSLYKGEEWKSVLKTFLEYKKAYEAWRSESDKGLFTWEHSVSCGVAVGKIRNHSMGTLLINISEGMDLDLAVKKWEDIVAPENYQRSRPICTKQMLENAQRKMSELGYLESMKTRYAMADDVTVNNVLFSNKDVVRKTIETDNFDSLDVFEEMMKDVAVSPKHFSKVEEITIENFISNVLPTTKDVEVLLENKHENNMVSLIAPQNKDAKTMYKWNNNFSWSYKNNLADSSMKENVKNAGGKVDGALRFSIQWNDDEWNGNDFDAHCLEPNGNRIYYSRKHSHYTGGRLDVDIINPVRGRAAVENITWSDKRNMDEGVYKFLVHNFSDRGGKGFKAEVEFDGQIHLFEFDSKMRNGEYVEVAEVYFNGENFTIKEKLPSNASAKGIWGLKSNQFIPVSMIMLSPNYWDEQQGVGNKHTFFFLKDCINDEMPNAFYNEFLNSELREHRKVMEALSTKLRVEDSDEQLSGLGFSSTRRHELIVRVKGQVERVLKIKF